MLFSITCFSISLGGVSYINEASENTIQDESEENPYLSLIQAVLAIEDKQAELVLTREKLTIDPLIRTSPGFDIFLSI